MVLKFHKNFSVKMINLEHNEIKTIMIICQSTGSFTIKKLLFTVFNRQLFLMVSIHGVDYFFIKIHVFLRPLMLRL